MHRRKGFALSEVVVVLAVLGVVAAFAIPRLVSLREETRTAAVQALASSLRSSAALSHTLWLAQGRPAAMVFQGRTIAMVNGYPDLGTIDDSLPDTSGFAYDAATGVFHKLGTSDSCAVTYREAVAGDAPGVTVDVGGC
jgi:MSHA pilin protein MshA